MSSEHETRNTGHALDYADVMNKDVYERFRWSSEGNIGFFGKNEDYRTQVSVLDAHMGKKDGSRLIPKHFNEIQKWREENHINEFGSHPCWDWCKQHEVEFNAIWPTETYQDPSFPYLISVDRLGAMWKAKQRLKAFKKRDTRFTYDHPAANKTIASNCAAAHYMLAYRAQQMANEKEEKGKSIRHIKIYDCEGLTPGPMSLYEISNLISGLLGAVLYYYPESLQKMILVNVPKKVQTALDTIKTFGYLDDDTYAKFLPLDGDTIKNEPTKVFDVPIKCLSDVDGFDTFEQAINIGSQTITLRFVQALASASPPKSPRHSPLLKRQSTARRQSAAKLRSASRWHSTPKLRSASRRRSRANLRSASRRRHSDSSLRRVSVRESSQ
jgi:hypothetical protein